MLLQPRTTYRSVKVCKYTSLYFTSESCHYDLKESHSDIKPRLHAAQPVVCSDPYQHCRPISAHSPLTIQDSKLHCHELPFKQLECILHECPLLAGSSLSLHGSLPISSRTFTPYRTKMIAERLSADVLSLAIVIFTELLRGNQWLKPR